MAEKEKGKNTFTECNAKVNAFFFCYNTKYILRQGLHKKQEKVTLSFNSPPPPPPFLFEIMKL